MFLSDQTIQNSKFARSKTKKEIILKLTTGVRAPILDMEKVKSKASLFQAPNFSYGVLNFEF
ncbi:hypothetical protein DP113_01220 [Brasilonema octagenarum UFV-E1]|uniref:Uncharacterized protein n=2 Tax=Brasilonema TaxID=383614 RepID=A0A856M8K0_9CYAN|nr:hypothetical protein [Brasilonema octagenarum UFV-OR1]QDL06714.1 hypothetical protein DP114_01230 [Brasilonema sennae CENA114]QDL13083.1 hypothetical protein DP113_01220 [Brasilonema octagenarum UFV-E1]